MRKILNSPFRLRATALAFLLLTAIAGCKPARDAAPDALPVSTADMVLQGLKNNSPDFEWMSTRFSGSVRWENQSQNIAGSMRIQRDQAIYISIAPILGIEVARALITPDSVKMVNRLESTYYLGDIGLINQMFGTDVDFYMLQSLFMGYDFPHFRNDQFSLRQEGNFLRLHAAQRTRTQGSGSPINQAIMVDPDNLRIRSNIILEENTNRAIRADYKSYDNVSGSWIPSDLQIMFSDDTNISTLNMLYTRVTLNEPQRMQFSIPSRYRPIHQTD